MNDHELADAGFEARAKSDLTEWVAALKPLRWFFLAMMWMVSISVIVYFASAHS